MKTHAHAPFVMALLLIGLGAAGLHKLRSAVRLGTPGVRMSNLPVLDEEARVARTNSVALPLRVDGHAATAEAIPRMSWTTSRQTRFTQGAPTFPTRASPASRHPSS